MSILGVETKIRELVLVSGFVTFAVLSGSFFDCTSNWNSGH